MAKYNPIVQNRISKLIQNIANEFEVDKISKSPARFNRQKLEWFNAYYIKMLSQDEFLFRCLDLSVRRQIGDIWKNPEAGTEDWQSKMNLIYQIFLTQNQMPNNLSVSHSEFSLSALDPEKALQEGSFEFAFVYLIMAVHLDQNRIVKLDQSGVCWQNDIGEIKDFKGFVDLEEYRPEKWTQGSYWQNVNYENTPDSWCILCYQKPQIITTKTSESSANSSSLSRDSILRWKKDTLEQSLENLVKIWELIAPSLDEIESQKIGLRKKIILDLKNGVSINFRSSFEYLVNQIEDIIKSELAAREMDFGSYLWPLRVCLSGKKKSPSPFELIAILSRSEIENRISLSSGE